MTQFDTIFTELLRFNQTEHLLSVVKLFVTSGTKINDRGGLAKGFGSPLHILCETNQTPGLYDVARYLVDQGALVTETDGKNNTVLHVLCRFNQTETLLPLVRYLVEKGVDINAKNDQGLTALCVLCQYNQSKHLTEVVRFFILNDANLTIDQPPVLSAVCKYNQTGSLLDLMRFLLESGADPNSADHDGSQAIHYCAQYQKQHLAEAVELLETWGAKLESLNRHRESFLHLACQYAGHLKLFDFVSSLPKNLVNHLVNLTDNVGRTPLHYAARVGCVKTVRYLTSAVEFRFIDGLGKSVMEYLENFITNKGSALCLCCHSQTYKSVQEIEAVCEKISRFNSVVSEVRTQTTSAMENSIPKQIDRVFVYNKCDKLVRMPRSERWKRFITPWMENLNPDVNGT